METSKNRQVVGLNGPVGCGKTTVANALTDRHGFTHIAIGDRLRAVAVALGYPLELFNDRDLKEVPRSDMYGLSPRELLISIGAWGRQFDQDYWIDRALEPVPETVDKIVISDVGTSHEAQYLRFDQGAALVPLDRPGVTPRPDGRILIDHPDRRIVNDGTPEAAADEIARFAELWAAAS